MIAHVTIGCIAAQAKRKTDSVQIALHGLDDLIDPEIIHKEIIIYQEEYKRSEDRWAKPGRDNARVMTRPEQESLFRLPEEGPGLGQEKLK